MPAPASSAFIDVVDERDERIGSVPRCEALSRGVNFRTSHVFLFNSQAELLLQRLAPTRARHAGRWGSSAAAYLHAGESYEDAARRRLREELGVSSQLEFIGKITMNDERSRKFVALFASRSDDAAIEEPTHFDRIAYWPLARLDGEVEAHPDRFTPTFRELYRSLRGRLR